MNNFKNIKKIVSLSPEKKALLWQEIEKGLLFSEKDVRVSTEARLGIREAKKSSRILPNKRNMFITIITLISLVFAGSASFAADSSLPGDTLYPIKVYVNESVESAFTFGSESEAKLQLARIEERVQERDALEARGELTVEAQASIDSQIKSHRDAFEREKSKVEASGEVGVSASLDSQLEILLGELSLDIASSTDTDVDTDSEVKTDVDANGVLDVNISGDTDNTNSEVDVDATLDSTIDGLLQMKLGGETKVKQEADTEAKTTTTVKTDADVKVDTSVKANTDVNVDIETEVEDMINGAIEADSDSKVKIW